jgi:hypothetical protein
MAPVDTEKQQKIDEQLSSSSVAAGSVDEQYNYAPYKACAVLRILRNLLIHISANTPNRFLAASERG